MYEARQNKEKVSRIGDATRQQNIKNRKTKSDENFSILNQSKNKYCFQYKLPDGLQEENKTATVWLKGRGETNGIMCTKIDAGKKDTKKDCLKNISENAAKIGSKTPNQTKDWEIGEYYNDKQSTKTNPFQVPIQSVFPAIQNGTDNYVITLYYHFGPLFYGYIVQVDAGSASGKMIAPNNDGIYNYIHHETRNDNILNQTDDQNNDDNIKFDAYTKLAGEGARFQCVRDNIDKISNDTYFYLSGNTTLSNQHICKEFTDPGVSFKTLYSKWGKAFSYKFNISNEDIKKAILNKSILVNYVRSTNEKGITDKIRIGEITSS